MPAHNTPRPSKHTHHIHLPPTLTAILPTTRENRFHKIKTNATNNRKELRKANRKGLVKKRERGQGIKHNAQRENGKNGKSVAKKVEKKQGVRKAETYTAKQRKVDDISDKQKKKKNNGKKVTFEELNKRATESDESSEEDEEMVDSQAESSDYDDEEDEMENEMLEEMLREQEDNAQSIITQPKINSKKRSLSEVDGTETASVEPGITTNDKVEDTLLRDQRRYEKLLGKHTEEDGLDDLLGSLDQFFEDEPSADVSTKSTEGLSEIQQLIHDKREQAKAKSHKPKAVKVVDSEPNASTSMPSKKRIAPDDPRISKRMRSWLNKLSNSALPACETEFKAIYEEHPSAIVTATLLKLILSVVDSPDLIMPNHLPLYAAVIRFVPQENRGQILEGIHDRWKEQLEISVPEAALMDITSLQNLTLLLAETYNVYLVAANVIYDVIRLLLAKNLELLVKVLKVAGSQLRHDDAAALKQIISLIPQQESPTAKQKYLYSVIADIKNNKIQEIPSDHPRFRLSGSTKGIAWTGPGNVTTFERRPIQKDERSSTMQSKITKKLKLSTPIRKQIVDVLMQSLDYIDASLKLTKLISSTHANSREIPRTLLVLAGASKIHNPFYDLVCQELCKEYAHQVTFKFALWDYMKTISEADTSDQKMCKEVLNMAEVYATLFNNHLPWHVVKAIEVSGGLVAQFWNIVMSRVVQRGCVNKPNFGWRKLRKEAKGEEDIRSRVNGFLEILKWGIKSDATPWLEESDKHECLQSLKKLKLLLHEQTEDE